MFRRKKKVVVKPAVSADDVIIGVAKTIGAAIGTASVAVEIGKQSASDAREMKPRVEKQLEAVKKNATGRKAREMLEPAAKQLADAGQTTKGKAKDAKKVAVLKVEEAKKVATDKVTRAKRKAEEKTDELRESAAHKIAPRRRGLLGRLRG
jgi:hypothetical protein